MRVKSFFKYVEIQTKLASMNSFSLGTVLAIYRYQRFDAKNFLLMFLSLFSFDMATTAINNYIDFKRARKKTGYGYEIHNAIVRDNISEFSAVTVIVVLLGVAVLSGFLLFLNTNYVILLAGAVSFAVGVLYSAGPVPISRTPFGEILSGLFMGFFIPFLSAYIHIFDTDILALTLDHSSVVTFQMNFKEVLSIFIVSIPAVMGIANIMLANNICDMEDDLENKRYTLPLYIGKRKAFVLFKVNYLAAYAAIIPALFLKILPITALLFFVTWFPVSKNIRLFTEKQTKQETFGLSVQNFTRMNVALILSLILGIGIKV